MPELRRWYLHQEADALKHPMMMEARANEDTNFVLMTRNGNPPRSSGIAQQLKNRRVAAGLHVLEPSKRGCGRSRITPHALRRTFATLLLNDGHHFDAVADVLGHVNLDTTRKHYAFSSSERVRPWKDSSSDVVWIRSPAVYVARMLAQAASNLITRASGRFLR